MQLVFIPDVVFPHQLWVVPEELQGGDFHVLISFQLQGFQQWAEVQLGNGIVAEAPPLAPQGIIAYLEAVFDIGRGVNRKRAVPLQAQGFQELLILREKFIDSGGVTAKSPHGVTDHFLPAFQNPDAVDGHILPVNRPFHFAPEGDGDTFVLHKLSDRLPLALGAHHFQVVIGFLRFVKGQLELLQRNIVVIEQVLVLVLV